MHSRMKFAALLLVVAGLEACAAPAQQSAPAKIDMEKVAEVLDCPASKTPACTTRMGRETRCFCTDKEALRDILDPKTTR